MSDEAREALRACASSTGRARAVMEQTLLRDGALAMAMAILPRSEVELAGVVSDVVGALDGSLRQRGGSVVVEGRLPVVRGDET